MQTEINYFIMVDDMIHFNRITFMQRDRVVKHLRNLISELHFYKNNFKFNNKINNNILNVIEYAGDFFEEAMRIKCSDLQYDYWIFYHNMDMVIECNSIIIKHINALRDYIKLKRLGDLHESYK